MAAFDLVGQLSALRDQLGYSAPPRPRAAPVAPPAAPTAAPAAPPAAAAGGGDWRSTLTPAEAWIIQRESSFRPTAKNPKSSAFGLGQLIIANRRKYAGRYGWDPWTTDPLQQLQMFRDYYKERYGSAEAAQRFWQQKGWY